jgi:hypothetical protein
MAETLINKGFQPFFIYSKIELGAVLGALFTKIYIELVKFHQLQ